MTIKENGNIPNKTIYLGCIKVHFFHHVSPFEMFSILDCGQTYFCMVTFLHRDPINDDQSLKESLPSSRDNFIVTRDLTKLKKLFFLLINFMKPY